MTATLDQAGNATHATSGVLLNFGVIRQRASDILRVAPADVTDGALGELLGYPRETIWRWRHGTMKPKFETASAVADTLGLTVDEIRAGNPSPPRPAAPTTPKPPAGPKPKAA